MCKVAMMKPKKTTTHVGCVQDLQNFLDRLDGEVDGLEEMYEINAYHLEDTGERWLEIKPSR